MIIEDTFDIAASAQEVWDLLIDIPAISACIPGAEQVEQEEENSFSGLLVVKVGPIKANFKMNGTLIDVDPPHQLTAKAQGKDKNTSTMVSATFTATLTESEPDRTEIHHKTDVAIRGRLGQFGQGVIRETAKELTQVFVSCLEAKVIEQQTLENSGQSTTDPVNTGSTVSSQSTNSTPLSQPSLLTIIFRAIIANIRNWFRATQSNSSESVE